MSNIRGSCAHKVDEIWLIRTATRPTHSEQVPYWPANAAGLVNDDATLAHSSTGSFAAANISPFLSDAPLKSAQKKQMPGQH